MDAFTRAGIVGERQVAPAQLRGGADQVEPETLGWTVYVLPQYVEVLGRPDERVPIDPDVAVQVGTADHLAGRDPVLAKAIALR